jgi:hypothetical protein
MVTIFNYMQKITAEVVNTLPKMLIDNHKRMIELIMLINHEPELYEDDIVNRAVDTHLEQINEFLNLQKKVENIPFEAEKNGQKIKLNKPANKVDAHFNTDELTELEQAIYRQRKCFSGQSNADIKRQFDIPGWQFTEAVNKLKRIGLITGSEVFYTIKGRPKGKKK